MILRDYQQFAVNQTFDYFKHNSGNPLIAMPTGTGKSLIIAGIIKQAMQMYGNQSFMVLTHVKELIEQNADKLVKFWPNAPVGIYSAGLGRKDTVQPVIFGGCGSVNGKTNLFGHRDLLIVDEAHLISPRSGSIYQQIILDMKKINPYLKVIGLSATPFRMGQGMIVGDEDDTIFDDICCDATGVEAFNWFIQQGYLAPLVPKKTKYEQDIEGVGRVGADLNQGQLQALLNKDRLNGQMLEEMCTMAYDRQAWMIFATGVEHSDALAKMLEHTFGISAVSVHSKISKQERADRMGAFKSGEVRCIVNKDILTTGFDHPPLDFIGMGRPTMSPGLWVQMLGRGTRPSPETGKVNCLVADCAGNTKNLGPINDPIIPKKKGKGGGEAPIRVCPECDTYNHASLRTCCFCGYEFPVAIKVAQRASTAELIKTVEPVYEEFTVDKVHYYLHDRTAAPDSIRVSYFCNGGFTKVDEFIHIQNTGMAKKLAMDWWAMRYPLNYIPETTAAALIESPKLAVPSRIKVQTNLKRIKVVDYAF